MDSSPQTDVSRRRPSRFGPRVILGAVLTGVLTGAAFAGLDPVAISIDEFTDVADANPWPREVDSFITTTGSLESSLLDVIGGERLGNLTAMQTNTSLDFARATIAPDVEGGVLDYTSTIFAAALLELSYGVSSNLNVDLSDQGGLIINFIGFDFPQDEPLAVSATIISGGESREINAMLSTTSAQSLLFSFDDIITEGTFDLTSVDRIDFAFNASPGADFRLSSIRTFVPAPGALTLLLGAGIATRRRRREA